MTARIATRQGLRFCSLTALAVTLGGVGLSAPAPVAKAEPPSESELAGLNAMHRYAVKLFIDRDGFGFRRVEPPIDDILGAPKNQAEAQTPQLRGTGEQAMAIRPGKDGKDAHFSLAKTLVPFAVIPPPVWIPNKAWVLKEVQLIGLVKHPDPVVYLSGGAADGPMAKDAKEKVEERTRKSDEFEAKALEAILGGSGVMQAERRGDTFRAVSSIHAGRQCAACHERTGEMLGAFTYRLALEDAPAPVKDIAPLAGPTRSAGPARINCP